MKSTWKKWISILLAVILMVQMLPTTAFATDGDDIDIVDDWEEDNIEDEIPVVESEEENEIYLVDEEENYPRGEEKKIYNADDVLWENQELREEGIKHFHLSDGTDVAIVYEQPVHYLDGAGVYQDIDNTLELVDRGEARIVPETPIKDSTFDFKNDTEVESIEHDEDIIILEEEELVKDPLASADNEESDAEATAEEPPEAEERAKENEEQPAEGKPDEEDSTEEDIEMPAEVAPLNNESDKEVFDSEQSEKTDNVENHDDKAEEKASEKTEVTKGFSEKEYRNRAGLVDVRLAELSNSDSLVSVSDGKNTLAFTPAWEIEERPAVLLEPNLPYDIESFEAAITPRKLSAGLRYEEVYPGVDLEYWVHPSGIKENIVLREPREEAIFQFVMDCGELTPTFEEDGSLAFNDRTGECIMMIPAGYMTDALGEFSTAVSYELEEGTEGKYLLTVRADEDWLNEEGRAYPVSIDPSTTVYGVTHNVIETARINNRNPNETAGLSAESHVGGKYYYDTNSVALMRTLVRINSTPNLPANSVLVNASFHFLAREYSGSGLSSLTISAKALSSNTPGSSGFWCIGKSWNTTPNEESQILDYATISSAGFYDWDITRYAQNWYDNSSTNYGFVLMAINESSLSSSSTAYVTFDSSTSGTGVQPYFAIQYRNTVGIEGYYTYQTHSIDRAGTGYVSDVSRQLTLVKTDAASASTVNPFAMSHVYNSALSDGEYSAKGFHLCGRYSNMSLGYGWKLSAQQTCSYHTNGFLVYNDADGTAHFLKDIGSGIYQDEDGLGLTATAAYVGGIQNFEYNYTLTDLYGNIKFFNKGTLQYEQDANGNRITYQFDSNGRITSVVRKNNGGSDETLASLSYNGNYLSSITDSAGNTTSFTYSGNYLTTVTHADGTTVSYTYSGGKLISAKDNESGYSVNYEWTSGKLSKYTEKAGTTNGASVGISGTRGITVFRYSGKDRTLGNSDDLITTYVFDYYGRTITTHTTNGDRKLTYGASGGNYVSNTDTGKTNNRLLTGAVVGIRPVGNTGSYSFSSTNLLNNGDMSANSSWSGGSYVEGTHFGRAIKLSGSITSNRSTKQTVTVNAAKGQTFILSAWAMGDSAALKDDRSFAMEAELKYSDDTTETQSVSFCPDSTAWQYMVLPIVPKKNLTISKIEVRFTYNKNVNNAYFTYACLTKESAQGYSWDSNGNLKSVSCPSNATQTYSYSGADLITEVTKGNGTFTYSYDGHHNVISVTNDGLSMTLGYDGKGNTTSSTLTGGSLHMGSSATYTNNGNLLASQTDTRGKTTSYAYDNNISKQIGRPTEITDPRGTSQTISYDSQNGRQASTWISGYVRLRTYYSSGQVSQLERKGYIPGVTDAVYQDYYINHNGFGQTTSVKVENRTLVSNTYASNNGVLTKMTYGNGNSFGYGYDNLERVTNVYYNNSNSSALSYSYWGEGPVKQLTDSVNNRTYAYTYDSLGRPTGLTEKYSGSNALTYSASYDTANRMTSYSYKVSPSWNGTLNGSRGYSFTYRSSDGALTGFAPPGTGVYSYTYDGLKRLTQRNMTRNGGVFLKRGYTYLAGSGSNTSTLVSGLTNKLGDGTNIASYSYSYDNNGNITGISGSTSASYTYDVQNQMLTETRGGTTYTYTYDTYGNIRSKTSLDGNGTDTYTYGDSEWVDLLTAYNGHAITYDAIGNPLTYHDGTTFTWVNGRRLASAVNSSTGLNNSYTYDADGLRLTKTVNGVEHKYLWLNGTLVSEAWDDKELEFFYDESGHPYGLRYVPGANLDTRFYFYVTNLQGDVVALMNGDGVLRAEYTYDAWGNILSSSGSMADINPLRYRGYYYDAESGFYYLKSRYYDPAICRFINADGLASTGQGFLGTNMFAYCLNNPINGCDPSGRWMWYKDENGNDCEDQSRKVIKYSVPLYMQGKSNLCWAYCQAMIESYEKGTVFSQLHASFRAHEIAYAVNGSDWNRGGWPTNRGDRYSIRNTLELYELLQNNGPLYAFHKGEDGSHLVVITGINLYNGKVYTNNPQGYLGIQSYVDFLRGYAIGNGQTKANRQLTYIYTVTNPT